jgi:pimeloyl-ACP methyl ester carboxylesterase
MNASKLLQAHRPKVIALHCSGAGAGEWSCLIETLGGNCEVYAPEQYGCPRRGHWTGERAFRLADEAEPVIAAIDQSENKIHLVGHSFGGGLALHIALARPSRILSMALYEPSAFHLLPQMGEAGANAYAEIASIADRIGQAVIAGDYRGGVVAFVDYWNPGSWSALRPPVKEALTRWAPKGPLDFRALMTEPTIDKHYCNLSFPVLLLCGEHAPSPTRIIAERLQDLLPKSRMTVVDEAGHMGPLTHAVEVSRLIAQHIISVAEPEK